MDNASEIRDLVLAMVGDIYPLPEYPNINIHSALVDIAVELQLLRKAVEGLRLPQEPSGNE